MKINIGFTAALGLLFIALKLTHQIDWSWVWVLSPFWLPLATVLGICAVAAVVMLGIILAITVVPVMMLAVASVVEKFR